MNTSAGTSPGAQDKGSGNTALIAGRQEGSLYCDLGNLLRGSGSNARAANLLGINPFTRGTLKWHAWNLGYQSAVMDYCINDGLGLR